MTNNGTFLIFPAKVFIRKINEIEYVGITQNYTKCYVAVGSYLGHMFDYNRYTLR